MFVTKNQIFVFLACVAIGGICGIFFTVAAFFKFFIKNKFAKPVPDIAAFVALFCVYLQVSFMLNFPSFRIYMTAGVIIGLLLYMKSFHIMLAFPTEKLYNITVKKLSEHKNKRKESKKDDVGNLKRRKVSNRGSRSRGRERIGSKI